MNFPFSFSLGYKNVIENYISWYSHDTYMYALHHPTTVSFLSRRYHLWTFSFSSRLSWGIIWLSLVPFRMRESHEFHPTTMCCLVEVTTCGLFGFIFTTTESQSIKLLQSNRSLLWRERRGWQKRRHHLQRRQSLGKPKWRFWCSLTALEETHRTWVTLHRTGRKPKTSMLSFPGWKLVSAKTHTSTNENEFFRRQRSIHISQCGRPNLIPGQVLEPHQEMPVTCVFFSIFMCLLVFFLGFIYSGSSPSGVWDSFN